MPYVYDPHRHVKIWLSKDKTVFLNPMNQLRLIRMRVKNPTDSIFFIYDSYLLTSMSQQALQRYCHLYNFYPMDVRQIIPQCTTSEEKNLIAIYQDEISNLNHGGSLAAASDILRWLRLIYTLGTYSDFDVEVNTHVLPSTLNVSSSLLFNFGSIRGLLTEFPHFTNDVIAVVDAEATVEAITSLQQAIYHQWNDPFQNFGEKNEIIPKKYFGLSSRALRGKIKEERGWDDERYYCYSVVQTTGPSIIYETLFGSVHEYSHDVFMEKIAPYSMKSYQLDEYFKSPDILPMHTCALRLMFLGQSQSDLSWLARGNEEIRIKEKQMKESAVKISMAYKTHQALKRQSISIELAYILTIIERLKSSHTSRMSSWFNFYNQTIHPQEQKKLNELYAHAHAGAFEARKFNALKYYSAKTGYFFEIKSQARLMIDRASLLSKQACLFALVDKDTGELPLAMS